MTDKTEAQPEALPDLDIDTAGHSGIRIRGYSVERVKSLHAEIQQLKAQLSARQAAPDGWRLVPVDATRSMINAAAAVEEDGFDAMHKAMLSAAPPPPEREPQNHAKNRELAETAMCFVDRAGDVHPCIDDADRICAEFHAARAAVVDKWHPMPMPPGIGATNDNP